MAAQCKASGSDNNSYLLLWHLNALQWTHCISEISYNPYARDKWASFPVTAITQGEQRIGRGDTTQVVQASTAHKWFIFRVW